MTTKANSPMKVITGVDTRWSYVNAWEPNASFERICLSRYLRDLRVDIKGSHYLNPVSWRCTLVWSAYNGLPLSLEGVGKVLKLDDQKLSEGKGLIRYFCTPCSPTKANAGRVRNLPCHAPGKWALFKNYNMRDVDVEVAIQKRLEHYPVPQFVWDEYHLDQEINDRGIAIDRELVRNAIACEIGRAHV